MTEGDLSHQAQSLIDLVAYQEGAVVSRTLLNKSTGTITLFAFDQGQALSEHTAPHDALVQVLDGAFEITVAGELKNVTQGQILLLPAHQPHAVLSPNQSKMLLIMIRG